MKYFFIPSYTKADKSGGLCGTADYTVRLAKNESEGCTLALIPNEGEEHVHLLITPFSGGAGGDLKAEIFRQLAVSSKRLDATAFDPIVPVGEIDVPLEAGAVNPFLIRLRAEKDTPAGKYEARITVFKGDAVLLETKLSAVVWNFALPDAPAAVTAFGIGCGKSGNFTIAKEQYKEYYDLLLSFGVCGYSLPHDVLSDEADAYMSDPKVKSFCVPYSQDKEKMRAYHQKLSQNPEWMKKAYFYPLDEPTSEEDYDRLTAFCRHLKEVFPGYRIVTPFYKSTDLAHKYMTGNVNIWCPETVLYDEDLTRTLHRRMALGDNAWWYVCCGPSDPAYCNLFTHWQGIRHRALFWQQKLYGVEGLLYWNTTYWDMAEDPWEEMVTFRFTRDGVEHCFLGDGMLFYPGEKIGIPGPVASLRLEIIRDGIEDFEYLTLAEGLLGRAFIEKIIRKVTTSVRSSTSDDELFAHVRSELGEAIEKALA